MAGQKKVAETVEDRGGGQWLGWSHLGSLSSHYPVLLVAAICFNLGYLSYFDADAITLLNVWDHLAIFIKNAMWISGSLFALLVFFMLTSGIGQNLYQRALKKASKTSGEPAPSEVLVLNPIPALILIALILVLGLAFLNRALTGTLMLVGVLGLVGVQVFHSLSAADRKALDPILLWLAAITTLTFLFGAGQLKGRCEASAPPSAIATIDGAKTPVHLIAALHSGMLVYGSGRLQWIESKRLTAVSFGERQPSKPAAVARSAHTPHTPSEPPRAKSDAGPTP